MKVRYRKKQKEKERFGESMFLETYKYWRDIMRKGKAKMKEKKRKERKKKVKK